jgi:peptidoglycan/xylan/chitin deacetylase (PgdA/CDA1 family)/GT2 family glycosyltransferase/SAM-dependent methyltransferase
VNAGEQSSLERGAGSDARGHEQSPLVTFVMPLFNKADTLAEAIASVRRQSVPRWRAIIVDDESSDDSLRIAQDLARDDNRITVLAEAHSGASGARNHAIAAAQTEWLMFLDADDWIADDALELLLRTAGDHPQAGCVFGAWRTFPATGEPFGEQFDFDPSERSFFSAISTGCGFPLHSAIVRTQPVRDVGGFDVDLITCEDWDLWLRLARSGVLFQSRAGEIAFYRTHAGSQSATGYRMLHDALLVIDRAYAPDARVPNPTTIDAAGASAERRAPTRVAHAVYAAGLMLGRGDAADGVLELVLDDLRELHADAETIAFELYNAIPRASGGGTADWWRLADPVRAALDAFLTQLEQQSGVAGAHRAIRRALEERIFSAPPPRDGPLRGLGCTAVAEVRLEQPILDVPLPEGVDRLRCVVSWRGTRLGSAVIPGHHIVPADIILDACVADHAWQLLELMMTAAPGPRARAFAEDGWTAFLRELWGLPQWPKERFYDRQAPDEDATPKRPADPAPVVVEILAPLSALVKADGTSIDVEVRLGGEPLARMSAPSESSKNGQELVADINSLVGFELCRVTIRQLLAGGRDGSPDLRTALADRPAAIVHDASPRVGRRGHTVLGDAGSRRALLDAGAREQVLESARAHGEPLMNVEASGDVRYDPSLLGATIPVPLVTSSQVVASDREPAGSDANRHFFEALYASADDPWGYTSPYEVRKYEQTLELIPDSVHRAIEFACAGGHFTSELAERVASVDALDVSELALERAARRCAGRDNVSFRRGDLFTRQDFGRGYDLAVCSEVLYYAEDESQVAVAADNIARTLRPGGTLIAAHHNVLRDDPTSPGMNWPLLLGARGIERILLADGRFVLERELYNDLYRVQSYRTRTQLRRVLRRPRPPRRQAAAPAATLPEDVAASFTPEGAVNTDAGSSAFTAEPVLPILMYHRAAPDGAPAAPRYRVSPEELEAQLSYLRGAGYRSMSLDELARLLLVQAPVPAKRVAITFDDGYADFAQFAAPLLDRYGFTATIFVVTDQVGATNLWDRDTEELALMDWDTLRALRGRGFTIGGHTASHPRLTRLDNASVISEISRCRTALRNELGAPARHFASPYGLRDGGIDALIGACGFQTGLSCEPSVAMLGYPLLRLPRLEVRGEMGLQHFVRLLAPNPE